MPRAERPVMPGYGVPEDLDGTLPWDWAESRLVKTRNYWVSTVDANRRPHSMPVWGLWLTDPDRFWFSCADDAFKAQNIRANPAVVVTNEDTVEVVSVEGAAVERPPTEHLAARYSEKYESDPEKAEALEEFMMGVTMFEVTPTKAFGIIEREAEFSERATRWVW